MPHGCGNLPDPRNVILHSSVARTSAIKQRGKQDAVNRKVRKQGKRPKLRDKEIKRDAAKDAAKRHHKKEALTKTNRTDYSFVYVGNIDPTITEHRLEEYFSRCGKVCRIQLRCSRGQAVSIGVAVPENIRTTRDRQYASIEFQDYRGARNALQLNGEELDGCELVVSITPTDLPEVQDIVDSRISEIKNRARNRNAAQSIPHTTARPLRMQPTEQIIDVTQSLTRKDRLRMFGLSFDKCVV